MRTIKNLKVEGKKVLLRVDFNVTLDNEGNIIDDIKVRSVLPTIKYLIKNKAQRIVLVSHMGRPIIRRGSSIENILIGNKGLMLQSIAVNLAKNLKIKYKKTGPKYLKDFILPFYQLNNQIWLMENIRFDYREELNDSVFSRQLSSLGDIYIDDAFGNAHRRHASMVGVTKYIPSYGGLLMDKEVKILSRVAKNTTSSLVIVFGGAKVSEKIRVLKKLVHKAENILLGGVMANTFLVSRKVDMKQSKYDKESVNLASDIYTASAGKFYLPIDLEWKNNMAVDIGKTTQDQYAKVIANAKAIFWNGTMGLTSQGNFKYALGTKSIIRAIADSKAKEKVICGGDTIAEVDKMGLSSKMTHISTGGGAAFKFLVGEKMPAIEALKKS
jgi:3-phosphoglycerate kinase